jgi:hypothetical protein
MAFSPAYRIDYSLSSAEGALVSVAIRVEPRRLEDLLEALAQIAFPINPQIYHDAEIEYRDHDGRDVTAVTTLVEFPAYLARIDDVFRALELYRFERQDVLVTSMLQEMRRPTRQERTDANASWGVRARKYSQSGN